MKKSKVSFRKKVGAIVKAEGGKSQAKMGDAMQLQSEVFKQCVRDPLFMAKGLILASQALEKDLNKRRARDARRAAARAK